MEEIHLKPKERLIDYDRVNTDIYCLKEGIIRIFHIEEYRESTFGFATPGTIILSPHAYYMQTPAFLIAENCKTPAAVMRRILLNSPNGCSTSPWDNCLHASTSCS